MPLSPDTKNYLLGRGKIFLKKEGEDGYIHLGNAPDFSIGIESDKLEHFSSLEGLRVKDLELVREIASTFPCQSLNSDRSSRMTLSFAFHVKSNVALSADRFISWPLILFEGEFIALSPMASWS